jgi:hypothetical protein
LQENKPVGQLLLYEKNFGGADVWKLNPKGMGSLWLKTSATWSEGDRVKFQALCSLAIYVKLSAGNV